MHWRKQKQRLFPARMALVGTVLFLFAVMLAGSNVAFAQPPDGMEADFGDAPGDMMTEMFAYDDGTPGFYPTYWDGWSPGTSRGPVHLGPAEVWLGDHITVEPIIDPMVISQPDDGDDGWVNLNEVIFNPCEVTILKVKISKRDAAPLPPQLFLNVWFDGNRDGDWEDVSFCGADGIIEPQPLGSGIGDGTPGDGLPLDPIPGQAMAYEWIVQDFVIDTERMLGNSIEIRVPTVLVSHLPPLGGDETVWVRFTLSEMMALQNPETMLADGRGPSEDPYLMDDPGQPLDPNDPNMPGDPIDPNDPNHPGGPMPMAMFLFGETEDYRIVPAVDLPPVDPIDPNDPTAGEAPDLGDAPDSNNRSGAENYAYYPDVPGYYPTIWEKPNGGPSGPKHRNAHLVWLGDWASIEDEADSGPDLDGINNIYIWPDGGDTVDADGADDGWLNWDIDFHNCQETRLKVLVAADTTYPLPQRMYLNVWFDGNRDGDWDDISPCHDEVLNGTSEGPFNQPFDPSVPFAFEWIVQDFVIDTAHLAHNGGYAEIVVPTVLVSHLKPQMDDTGFAANAHVWMRFMLSDEPAPKVNDLQPARADGRGLAHPAMFRTGETEDYMWYPIFDEYEQPGQDTYPLSDLGDAPDSERNHHGPMQATAYWPDVPGYYPTVFELPADAPADAPRGPKHHDARVVWLGDWVSTEFEADVDYDEDGPNNMLDDGFDWSDGDWADDGWMNYEAKMPNCEEAFLKFMIGRDSTFQDMPQTMYLNAWFDGDRDGDWEDQHECGASANGQQRVASEWIIKNHEVNVASFPSDYTEIKVLTHLIPNLDPGAPAWVRFTLSETPAPTHPATNMADGRGPDDGYRFGETEDYFREVFIDEHPTSDLGDAPDSTNGRMMNNTAYWEIGQLGYFPTAWRNADPSGPKHQDPYAVRLGPWVSGEAEAAQGPDEDGQNNILSWNSDSADMDQFDDGWQNQWIGLKDCDTTVLEVKISKDMYRDQETMPDIMYLNVWFDGNRDGDWDDVRKCQSAEGEQLSFEWIVQDKQIDIVAMTEEFMYIEVPTALVLNDHTTASPMYDTTGAPPASGVPDEEWPVPAYLRFMLSEMPAPVNPETQYPDGRGPSFDDAFQFGETEDYMYWPPFDSGDHFPDPNEEFKTVDLGDAPDSVDNHSGTPNTAYKFEDGTVVDGHFPTVWNSDGGSPSGPSHADNWAVYMGYNVSYEEEADTGFDMDGSTNILNRGWDVSDQDMDDDGWINKDWAVFPDCRETMLEVQLTGAPPREFQMMYLNVWFDGNRDGDWGDTKPCDKANMPQPGDQETTLPLDPNLDDAEKMLEPATGGPLASGTVAHEWVVQNFPIDVRSLHSDLQLHVPTFIVMNDMPHMPAWVRFTLSERPVDDSFAPFQHDGRGPEYPDRYEFGETEDYLYEPPFDIPHDGEPGEVGEIAIAKTATIFDGIDDVEITDVNVGDSFWYNIELKQGSGAREAEIQLMDWLPEGLHIIDGPFVEIVDGVATPLWANVFGGFGMPDQVEWMGQLWPNSKIRVRFEVMVEHCPFNPERSLFNKAEAWTTFGTAQTTIAENVVRVNCDFLDDAREPEIFLDKWIRVERADLPDMGNNSELDFSEIDEEFNPIDFATEFLDEFGEDFELGEEGFWFDPRFDYVEEHSIAPGRDVFFQLVLGGFSPVRETIFISDTMPAGLEALEVSADRGIAEIADGVMTWRGAMGPETPPVFIKLRARPNDKVFCESTVKNMAYWRMRKPDGTVMTGQSNEAKLRIICRDLGDAPDSVNHYGTPMEAYAGVDANFPTVHKLPDTRELRGPMHQEAKPFHLGRGVSREREADIGGDADGLNNIMVFDNHGDFDDYDDGVSRYDIEMAHCAPTTLRVIVAIDEKSMDKLLANEGFGFLNVWLDGNRDGDWNDIHECGDAGRSPEHIVIDHGIDALDLGPGVHEIEVETTVPVFWPEEEAGRPAWARATLSERRSYKMLPEGCEIGSCRFGDGRGHPDFAFALGETEDYLVRPYDPQGEIPTDGADPMVEKDGRLRIRQNPRTNEEEWLAEWKVEYSNFGYGLAENVMVEDSVDSGQTIVSYSSFPPRPANKVDETVTFSAGDMAPGQTRYINMRSTLPLNAPAGTVLTNTVTIMSDNDENADNNTVVVTMTIPLQAPIITYPLPGTTCTGTITVTGRAQPGVMVDLYIDGVKVTNTDGEEPTNTEPVTDTEGISGAVALTGNALIADEFGRWSFATTLVGDGEHTIYAIARTSSGIASQPSETVVAIVDSSIYWNPMSLRFRDETGHVVMPRDDEGRLDETGWGVPLRPETTYTVTLEVCCSNPSRSVTLIIPGVDGEITLTDADNDNVFVGTFTTNTDGVFEGEIRVCVLCGLIEKCSDGRVLIDPEGTVFSLLTGLPISGAEVICLEKQQVGSSTVDGTDAVFSRWAAEDFNEQINPQIVGDDGYFSFFTPPGTFRLQVSAEGYYDYMSKDLVVVDEPVHFDVPLMPVIDVNDPNVDMVTLTIDENGFNPPLREIEPGTIVKWINLDTDSHSATSTLTESLSYDGSPSVVSAAGITATDAWDTGLIDSGDEFVTKFAGEGTYTYYDANNPSNTATIVVTQGAEEPPADLNNVNVGDSDDPGDGGRDGGGSGDRLFLPLINLE